MARKKKHEEHVNAEAWAIPYGDLVTLLFALFTVMYAMSSVNEGKFRVLSDSMIAAFNGAPKSMRPVNVGQKEPGKGGDKQLTGVTPTVFMKIKEQAVGLDDKVKPPEPVALAVRPADVPEALTRMQRQVQDAMQSLIDAKLVTVRRENMWLEIEINADILFPSGSADFATAAVPVLDKLAQVLKPFANPIRVEGHTDDRPIRTSEFPSNWELSAARAASVVHQFTRQGVDPLRLEIVGFGEFHPRQANDTADGRNANRRVVVMVLEEVPAPTTAAATAAGAGSVSAGSATTGTATAGTANAGTATVGAAAAVAATVGATTAVAATTGAATASANTAGAATAGAATPSAATAGAPANGRPAPVAVQIASRTTPSDLETTVLMREQPKPPAPEHP